VIKTPHALASNPPPMNPVIECADAEESCHADSKYARTYHLDRCAPLSYEDESRYQTDVKRYLM
jgi:hypothetical protein